MAVRFGDRLRQALLEKSWSNSQLARQVQASRKLEAPPTRTIGLYLSGRRLPEAPLLVAVADALGVSADWLLGGHGPMYRNQPTETPTLVEELRVLLARELVDTLAERGQAGLNPHDLHIDVRLVLDGVVREQAEALESQLTDAVRAGPTFRLALERLANDQALSRLQFGKGDQLRNAVWDTTSHSIVREEIRRIRQSLFDLIERRDATSGLTRAAIERLSGVEHAGQAQPSEDALEAYTAAVKTQIASISADHEAAVLASLDERRLARKTQRSRSTAVLSSDRRFGDRS